MRSFRLTFGRNAIYAEHQHVTTFIDLNLSPELNATMEALGYCEATPVRAKAIPLVLAGHDLIAGA